VELIGGYIHCGKLEFVAPESVTVHQGESTEDLTVRAAGSIGLELIAPDVWRFQSLPRGRTRVTTWERRYAIKTEPRQPPREED
jgi:hypothetical protein